MIHFYLSQTLGKDLEKHLAEPPANNSGALQWYAHRVTIARRKCIIALELQSRYAMVFCGLTKTEFEYFPELFQDRLWREVISICALDDDDDIAEMSNLVLNLSVEQHYAVGSNRSVQSHIRQVADELAWMVDNDPHRLPMSGSEAFAFGLDTNEMLRSTKEFKGYFKPLAIFSDFWLGLLAHQRQGQNTPNKGRASSQKTVTSQKMTTDKKHSGDNVIHVDFANKRKES